MQGWILYKRNMDELTEKDHGVNRLLSVAADLQIELKVYNPAQLNILVVSGASSVLLDDKPVKLPNFIIPRLGAETTPHAFALIRHLELQGVYSANSAMAIELVRDKLRVAQLLAAHQLPTPKTILLNFPVSLSLIEQELSFPLVIKTIAGAKGIGVFLCETANSFQDLMGLFGPGDNRQIIAQEFIACSYGRDLRVLVLGSRVIGCMQRTAQHSFKANYSLGGDVEAFPLTQEIEQLAIACAKLTNLDIAGIDLLFGPEGYVICEANSSPGFKGMELATGDDIAKKIIDYILTKCPSEPRTLASGALLQVPLPDVRSSD